MNTAKVEQDAEAFIAKWVDAWPALALARLFASPGEWPLLRGRVGSLFEIGEACWVLRDATVREHKLAWWQEDLTLHAQGQARHPLLAAARDLHLPAHLAGQALVATREIAPANPSQALTRIVRMTANTVDPPIAVACTQAMLVALYLLALREGQPSAFAQAPLDLRARHAVASAETGVALAALVATLASSWRDELVLRYRSSPRSHWHGARGLRVLHQQALALIEALAAGRGVPTPGWRSAWSAWRAVAGLR